MENYNIGIWIAAIVGACIGGFIIKYLINVNPDPPMNVDEEYADGEIAFDDMVAYFKSLHLKRTKVKLYMPRVLIPRQLTHLTDMIL